MSCAGRALFLSSLMCVHRIKCSLAASAALPAGFCPVQSVSCKRRKKATVRRGGGGAERGGMRERRRDIQRKGVLVYHRDLMDRQTEHKRTRR